MTIKDLKELIENVDDDVVILVKNDGGMYDIADDGYEDTEVFETWVSWRKETQRRKVFRIY